MSHVNSGSNHAIILSVITVVKECTIRKDLNSPTLNCSTNALTRRIQGIVYPHPDPIKTPFQFRLTTRNHNSGNNTDKYQYPCQQAHWHVSKVYKNGAGIVYPHLNPKNIPLQFKLTTSRQNSYNNTDKYQYSSQKARWHESKVSYYCLEWLDKQEIDNSKQCICLHITQFGMKSFANCFSISDWQSIYLKMFTFAPVYIYFHGVSYIIGIIVIIFITSHHF